MTDTAATLVRAADNDDPTARPASTAEAHPIDPLAGGLTLAAAALLAACGGGGGDGDSGSPTSGVVLSPAPAPGPGPSPSPSPSPSPGPGPAAVPTSAEAARFLTQGGLNASDAAIAEVKAQGYAGWIDAQFNAPTSQSHWDWLVANGYTDVTLFRNGQAGWNNTAWRKLVSSPDPLRQRIVWALTEFFVVSIDGLNIPWRQFASAAYLDMLERECFGNFRSLLEAVTLSVAMGSYLNMRGNQREDLGTGRVPDENYAREVLQLFTIGLFQLNRDGSVKTDGAGHPLETYDQATISGLAKVFTGWDYATTGVSLTTSPERTGLPMAFTAARHSSTTKTFLGTTIAAGTDGVSALRTALDTIFNHPNVGPFFGKQLIQRLVTSNPSAAYVDRVAAAFENNGAGVRGDMKAVIRAVLLDREARALPTTPAGGKLREPMLRFVQWARTFNATTAGTYNFGSTADPATRLGQSPLRAPSVFNFFRPGYVPPNTALGSQGLVAPELQITNESTVVGYVNFMQTAIGTGLLNQQIVELRADYANELPLADDVSALVDRVVLLMAANQLSAPSVATIKNAVGSISGTTDAARRNRIYSAILLVMASPEYLVQK